MRFAKDGKQSKDLPFQPPGVRPPLAITHLPLTISRRIGEKITPPPWQKSTLTLRCRYIE